jgi:16S rRNA pseudouridine516 synthase
MGERLDALLAHAGFGSRSDVKKLIRAGRATVDGVVERDAGRDVRGRAVAVDGEPATPPRRDVVLLMYKPVGLSCSHDPAEDPLVFDTLPEEWGRTPLECVGRLDRETSGLLVLTDDGALNHRLTSPKRHVLKRYEAAYTGALAGDAAERFRAGILLKDEEEPTRPATLTVVVPPAGGAPGRAIVELSEGRYHQVRRMIAACGGAVVALHRTRIGALELPADLRPGAVREATADEVARLAKA